MVANSLTFIKKFSHPSSWSRQISRGKKNKKRECEKTQILIIPLGEVELQ